MTITSVFLQVQSPPIAGSTYTLTQGFNAASSSPTSYTITWPGNAPGGVSLLQSDSNGQLSWVVSNITTLSLGPLTPGQMIQAFTPQGGGSGIQTFGLVATSGITVGTTLNLNGTTFGSSVAFMVNPSNSSTGTLYSWSLQYPSGSGGNIATSMSYARATNQAIPILTLGDSYTQLVLNISSNAGSATTAMGLDASNNITSLGFTAADTDGTLVIRPVQPTSGTPLTIGLPGLVLSGGLSVGGDIESTGNLNLTGSTSSFNVTSVGATTITTQSLTASTGITGYAGGAVKPLNLTAGAVVTAPLSIMGLTTGSPVSFLRLDASNNVVVDTNIYLPSSGGSVTASYTTGLIVGVSAGAGANVVPVTLRNDVNDAGGDVSLNMTVGPSGAAIGTGTITFGVAGVNNYGFTINQPVRILTNATSSYAFAVAASTPAQSFLTVDSTNNVVTVGNGMTTNMNISGTLSVSRVVTIPLTSTYVYANASGQLVADPGMTYLPITTAASTYLPLTGGSLSGTLTVTKIANAYGAVMEPGGTGASAGWYISNLIPNNSTSDLGSATYGQWNNFFVTTILFGPTAGSLTPPNNVYIYGGNDSTVTAQCHSWTSLSSRAFKENIVPIMPSVALDLVSRLQGVNFTWIEGQGDNIVRTPGVPADPKVQYGFIAEDLFEVYPQACPNPSIGVDYSKLTPILVEAVKAQQATITSMQATITSMQASLAALIAKVGA